MKKLVASTVMLLVALSACGGGGGRPSTADIEDALKSSDNELSSVTEGASDDIIACIAKELHDSDVSDEALQALVDNDKDYDASSEDQDALTAAQDDLAGCATA